MGQAFLRLARDLGYQASYFNLVRGLFDMRAFGARSGAGLVG